MTGRRSLLLATTTRRVVWAALLALLLTQFLGHAHRILHPHAPNLSPPVQFAAAPWLEAGALLHHGHDHGPRHGPHGDEAAGGCTESHPPSGWERLFGGHEHAVDCEAYDHLSQAVGLASAGLPEGTAPGPSSPGLAGQVLHWAAQAQGYLARGPPPPG